VSDHGELWSYINGLREDLGRAEERVRELEDAVAVLKNAVAALKTQTPSAQRLQHEADVAAADLAASGYDRHGTGCGCGYCYVPGNDEDGAS
jgi:hypothetical protein